MARPSHRASAKLHSFSWPLGEVPVFLIGPARMVSLVLGLGTRQSVQKTMLRRKL